MGRAEREHLRASVRFEETVRALADAAETRYVLAELNDILAELAPVEFSDAVAHCDLAGLTLFLQNYVAAMVEHAATSKGVPPPSWTQAIEALEEPHFASPLRIHRLHLLRASPVAFKRRNIFVDASVGARV